MSLETIDTASSWYALELYQRCENVKSFYLNKLFEFQNGMLSIQELYCASEFYNQELKNIRIQYFFVNGINVENELVKKTVRFDLEKNVVQEYELDPEEIEFKKLSVHDKRMMRDNRVAARTKRKNKQLHAKMDNKLYQENIFSGKDRADRADRADSTGE
jgi:hypothetical protein